METNGHYKVLYFLSFGKLENVHLLHIFQPPLSWEQIQVLVYYVKVHKRGKHNVITMNYTWEKCDQ